MNNNKERKEFVCTNRLFKVIDGTGYVSRSYMAHIFNVCMKTVYDWTIQGMPYLKQGKEKLFQPEVCIEWWLRNIYQIKNSDSTNLKEKAEIRKKTIEADIKEIELAKAKGSVIALEDISKQLSLRGTYFKTALMDIPKTIAIELLNCEDEKEISAYLTDVLTNVLDVFSKELETRQKDEFSNQLKGYNDG